MKIIISPSKTQTFKYNQILSTSPMHNDKAEYLVHQLKQLSKDELSKLMKIKDNLLEQTYFNFQNFHIHHHGPAIFTYTGTVFKEIKLDSYTHDEFNYMNEHIRILSALYGLLKPLDGIKPYRLDMTMKILNLYNYWEVLNKEFQDDDLIINLASEEFSQIIKKPMTHIHFLENKSGTYKNISTYSKKARGVMLNFLIQHQIKSIEDLKQFNLEHYSYNSELSTSHSITFTR